MATAPSTPPRTLTLAPPFVDHMILQRGRPTRLWGWDQPGRTVGIALEGAGVHFSSSAQADARGEFSCALPTLNDKGPYRLVVEGTATVTVDDILAGEVWLASGQSNMEWTVAQAADAEREAAAAHFPEIRCLYVARTPAKASARTVGCHWFTVSPETVGSMTAVGYFFARELHQRLGVPVGIIDASWGGTRVEAWTPGEALASVVSLASERARFNPEPEELRRITEEHAAEMALWEAEMLPADPENQGEGWGFHQPDFNDGGWRELEVPGMWQRAGMNFNGAVWYRRWIELPQELWEQDLWLNLGAIDDFDHTYVNGELVGSHPKGTTGAFQIQRRYRVPARLLRQGWNVIAVRVFDHVGEGGFLGPSPALSFEGAERPGPRVPLAGRWRAGVEREIPLVPMTVFASLPPTPEPLQPQNGPAALFNGMIAPLCPFGIRGTIFYQGESNTWAPRGYAACFTALIRGLRARFEQGPFPFYFVELAGFFEHEGWPLLREAQAAVLSEPQTGMAAAMDLGDPNDIHPRNKLDVGRRLAALALTRTYGLTGIATSGPVLEKVDLGYGQARVHFAEAESLGTNDGEPPRGFEVASKDGVFYPADVVLEGSSVLLTSERTPHISAVRYAFKDYVQVNLVNAAGLPARPFRTDRD